MIKTAYIAIAVIIRSLMFAIGGDRDTNARSSTIYPNLQQTIDARIGEFDQIPKERRAELGELADMIRARLEENEPARLVFICTHNSRRSHMAQLWAAVAARHYEIDGIHTYSGGTESTAFNPRAVAALQRAGLRIDKTTDDENPIYHVRFADGAHPLTCFSKVYDQAPNPKVDFIAVMTCDHANEACPIVRGAAKRIAIAPPRLWPTSATLAECLSASCRIVAPISRVSSSICRLQLPRPGPRLRPIPQLCASNPCRWR